MSNQTLSSVAGELMLSNEMIDYLYRFRMSIFAGSIAIVAVLFSTLRVLLSEWLGEKKGSILRTRPAGVTNDDARKYVMICVTVTAVFCYIQDPIVSHPLAVGTPAYLEPADRLSSVENRFTNFVVGLILSTIVYKLALPVIKKFISADQADAQAANVVRVGIKLSLLIWFFGINCSPVKAILLSKPGELSEPHFECQMIAIQVMAILYVWELMFRELKPINVAHHAYTIASCWAMLEWLPIDQPVRQIGIIPIAGSLIESVCCIGTMCYRFLAPSKQLSKLLVGEGYFVIVAYNLLAVSFFSLMYAFHNYYSTIMSVSLCGVYLFTYPAQMNMAKMFFALARKTRANQRAAQEQRRTINDSASVVSADTSVQRRNVPQHVR